VRWIIGLLLVIGCGDKTPQPLTYEYKIDPRLKYYVEDFYTEAQKRNVCLEKENLIVEIVDVPDSMGAIGLATLKASGQRIIQIDSTHFELYKYNFYMIENLVFHEMGHVVLERRHNNHYSLMNTLAPHNIYNLDLEMRKLLLHELFYGDTVNIWDK